MADKEKSAELILRLYELRRDETMRKARNWMMGFNPDSAQEIADAYSGEHSAYIRMVTTYWDMACSMVNHGAIDEEMFNDANAEHAFVFAKIHPFISEIRAMTGPRYLPHLEQLVMRMPDAEQHLEHLRQMSRRFATQRDAAASETAKA
jgi:hypothetical protein